MCKNTIFKGFFDVFEAFITEQFLSVNICKGSTQQWSGRALDDPAILLLTTIGWKLSASKWRLFR